MKLSVGYFSVLYTLIFATGHALATEKEQHLGSTPADHKSIGNTVVNGVRGYFSVLHTLLFATGHALANGIEQHLGSTTPADHKSIGNAVVNGVGDGVGVGSTDDGEKFNSFSDHSRPGVHEGGGYDKGDENKSTMGGLLDVLESSNSQDGRILTNDCSCSGGQYTIDSSYQGATFQSLVANCYDKDNRESCPPLLKDSELNCWDVSAVTDMSQAFFKLEKEVDPIGCWNVDGVTNMYSMFREASAFNQPLDSWNVGQVVDMSSMFNGAQAFNQPLDSWNVAQATNTEYMFQFASAFNGQLDSWNVSQVRSMQYMFWRASAFNQPLDSWNVAKVTTMCSMFLEASHFNQSLDSWDGDQVKAMHEMFFKATNFNQCLGTWAMKTPDDVGTSYMFLSSGCTNKSQQDANVGPWCKTESDGCVASSA